MIPRPIKHISREDQSRHQDAMVEAILTVIHAHVTSNQISPLSASVLSLHASAKILHMMGGPTAQKYIRALGDVHVGMSEKSAAKADAKALRYIEEMSLHFDTLIARPEGSA